MTPTESPLLLPPPLFLQSKCIAALFQIVFDGGDSPLFSWLGSILKAFAGK